MSNNSKLNFLNTITSTGIVGQDQYDIGQANKIRIVIEEAGISNVILVKAKINLQNNYTLIKTITGSGTFTVDVGSYDVVQFECSVYDNLGALLVVASSFIDYTPIDDNATDTGTTWSSEKINDLITELEDKNVRSTRFATISSGTSGTLTIPLEQTIILDDFGGTVDAIVTTISNGRPTTSPSQNISGTIVAATLDTLGNYSFTSTPSTYPIALIYRVRQKFSTYLDTNTDIIGLVNYEEVNSVNGETGTVILDTGDISSISNNRYVSDANLVVINNTSGTNTGDVSVGTANGLSLISQQLSQGLSSSTQNGALSSTDWNTFNNKQSSGNYITDLVGDVTGSGPGSTTTTLATVNSNVGSFGSASNVSTITLNNKGLATAAVNTPIQITESQVTNLVSDLALKAPLASPTFTGIPAAPTASLGNNSTQIATTAYVDATAAAGTPDATTLVKGKVKLAGDLAGTADLPTLKNTGTADTYTKVTTDAQGRVSSGTTLVATDIPNLDFTKITTGIVPIAQGGRNSSTALSGSSIMVSDGTAIVQGPAGTTTTLLHGNAAGLPTYGKAVLTTDVSGILPTANGGTNKSTWTAGNVPFASTTTAFGEDATGQFTWNNTNKRLSIGASGSGKVNTTVTTGSDPGLTAYMTGGTGNALEIKNQNAYSASLINASASATAGASIGWSFSRGTNASRTQSLSGDQIGSITGNGYTGTAFAGFTNAISFIATENTTATTTGGKIVLSTTPNGTTVPVSRVEIDQNGVVNVSNLTASLPVKTDASKNLISTAIDLASSTEVTGTLPESKGGTGATQIIKTLNTNTTSTGNTAGVETTLFTFSIPASTLSIDGNKIYGDMAGSFAGSISTDKRVKVKFGATTIFDSGNLGVTSASDWYMYCLCVRVSATTQICTVSFHSSSSVLSASASVVTTAETLSGAVNISVTGQGTLANDVTGKLWNIEFKP